MEHLDQYECGFVPENWTTVQKKRCPASTKSNMFQNPCFGLFKLFLNMPSESSKPN